MGRAWALERIFAAWCRALLVSVVFISGCAGGEAVTRRRGEVEQTGRRISSVAYAWYARGVHHENNGELMRAEQAFRSALQYDAESGMAWASLGRLLCRRSSRATSEVFEKGLRKAERRAPVLIERGKCRLHRTLSTQGSGRLDTLILRAACRDGEEAMRLEPENPKATEFLSECLRALGRPDDAARLDRAARLYFAETPTADPDPNLAAVDRALQSEDLERARLSSLGLVTPGGLALRAAAWGKAEIAREQAHFVLSAAPHDAEATVALVYLGDRRAMTSELGPLSPLGALLMARVLMRTIGHAQAATFLSQFESELSASEDPLVDQLWQELSRADR